MVLRSHLDRLADDERAGLVQRVAEGQPEPVIDYVRLNVTARRA